MFGSSVPGLVPGSWSSQGLWGFMVQGVQALGAGVVEFRGLRGMRFRAKGLVQCFGLWGYRLLGVEARVSDLGSAGFSSHRPTSIKHLQLQLLGFLDVWCLWLWGGLCRSKAHSCAARSTGFRDPAAEGWRASRICWKTNLRVSGL